jgi:hypothetical protein
VFDVGILQLSTLIDDPGVTSVTLDTPAPLPPGTPVKIVGMSCYSEFSSSSHVVGFGAPDFLHLHQSDRMFSIQATNASGLPPDDLLFFHDNISLLASTTAATPQEGVEVADEGVFIFAYQFCSFSC